MNLTPIRDLVQKTRQLDPKKLGVDSFTYVDISSVDKDTKKIVEPQTLLVGDAPSRARKEIKVNDVLVATVRPNLNGVAIVPAPYGNQIASTGFCILRSDTEQLDPYYLFYFTQTDYFISHLTELSTGAGYPAVSDEDILDTRIPLPPLTEQKRIASLLARADRLRQLRRTAHDLGDALLQSVFLEMFGDFNEYEKVLFDELALKSKNSFANGPFGSNLLTTELVSKGVPVLYIRDISSGYYQRVSKAFVTPQKAKELDSCRADGGDVLIAKVGDPPGTAAVYPISEPAGIISQDVIRIKPNREIINPEYLARFINSEVGRNILKPILVEGTRERFGLTPMKQLAVPLPPLSLQEEFAGVVARVESLRGRMGESERQVKGLFESLLAESFGGVQL